MGDNTKQLSFTLTERQKRAIRRAAAEQDVTMSELARNAVLDSVPGRYFTDDSEPMRAADDVRSPLEDFIDSRLTIEGGAGPISKKVLYTNYRRFCEDQYPAHDVESQHKFSREIGALHGVETARRYLQEHPTNDSSQTRCFLHVRYKQTVEMPDFD